MSHDPGRTDIDAARLAGLLSVSSEHLLVIADRDRRVVAHGGVGSAMVTTGERVADLLEGFGEVVEGACDTALAGGRVDSEAVGTDLLLDAAPLRREGGVVVEALLTFRDISVLRDEQRLRRHSDHQYRNAFERAPVAMLHVDRGGVCQLANDAMAALVGLRRDDLHGERLAELVHPDDRSRVMSAVRAMSEGSLPWYRSEDRFLHAGGPVVMVTATAAPIATEGGGISHVLFHLIDVTDQRDLEMQLRAMVDEDPLTRLSNRRSFQAALSAQSGLVARYGGTGAILVLDIDRFKQINDLFGHRAGDELLVRFAEVLRSTLRSADVIARIGGDEFAVILSSATPDQAEQVAAKLVEAVRARCQAVIAGRTRSVTTSVGIATFDRHDTDGSLLLMRADQAMYDAKAAGRDRYSMYRASELRALPNTRMELVGRIEEALLEGHFSLDAQPVLDLRTGATRDYELLLRMHQGGGTVPPAAFLGVAEAAGLLGRIDRWVLGRAMELLTDPAVDPAVRVTVNISAVALAAEETLLLLEERFAAEPLLPGRMILEVPESSLVAQVPDAATLAERLHRLDIRLSLDDFRAGFGAFGHLQDLPFDQVKIDGKFVRGCLSSPADRLVVKALVEVAHGLGKAIVAEFVEDKETLQYLMDEDVDFAQGFLLGRPFPSAELARRGGSGQA